MQAHLHSLGTRRLAAASLLGLALALTGAGASAQNQIATSPNHVALLRATPAGLERLSSPNHEAVFRADWQHLEQTALSSPSGRNVLVSTLGAVSFAPFGPPLVALVEDDRGPSAGGTATAIQGLRLTDANGMASVDVGGAAATVGLLSPTRLEIVTGTGLSAIGNPLGSSDVTVTHAAGTGSRTDAFVYQPAIRSLSSGSIGAALQLEYTSDLAGTFYQLWAGGIFPGVTIPIPPFAGQLEVWNPAFELTPLTLAAGTEAALPIFIPNDATLIGATLWFQGVSITQFLPSLQGTFLAAIPVTFVP